MLASLSVLTLLTLAASSTKINGLEYCIGPFALCASSHCTALPGNGSYATCACQGPFTNGLNLGNSTTCKTRSESLISTFSLQQHFDSPIHQPQYTFACDGEDATSWVNCLDAPCSTETGAVVCTCPIQPASANLYVGPSCPKSAAEKKQMCLQLRATQSLTYFSPAFLQTISGFYANPASPAMCNSTF